MAVITSTRLSASPQADGRLAVRELHTADGGESEVRSYLALPGDDLDALLTLHGAQFLQRLAEGQYG